MRSWLLAGVLLLGACAHVQGPAIAVAEEQVREAERAFAQTMADRDLDAFASFVSEEAVFFTGPEPLRGRQQVVDGWRRYFAEPEPPFSWEPEEIAVLASGTLALSSGPVRDLQGRVIARYMSIWRLEGGTWRVIFDKCCDACR